MRWALAYSAWAPTGVDGKVPDGVRSEWLHKLAQIPIPRGYAIAFDRWHRAFRAFEDVLLNFTLSSRLLVGHGNPSATDVGLTLHHPWGVPVIPGSALKGLCSHYIVSTFGPEAPSAAPWEVTDAPKKSRFQGVLWDESRRQIKAGPGPVNRALFGAPDAQADK